MNILILSSPNPYKSAGIVAKDMLVYLRSLPNVDIKLITQGWIKQKDIDIMSVDSFYRHYLKKILRKSKNVFNRLTKNKKSNIDKNYYILQPDLTKDYYSTETFLKKLPFTPDVIIVLFMPKFLNFKNLYELNKNTGALILLYMMDMAPMTGGCHYAWNCKGYTKTCGNCPGLFSDKLEDQSYLNWKFKKGYIEKTKIIPIAATEWQYKQLQESTLFSNSNYHKILLPINDGLFSPADKEEVRKSIKLPIYKKIILFAAMNIGEKRKGFSELVECLRILKDRSDRIWASDILLVITGIEQDNYKSLFPFDYLAMGSGLSHEEIAKLFQAADLFVCPSIEDSGPMMINQSIMCGTPVVSFEMGVALDLVITGKTGYRAKLGDSSDLANGIKYIMDLDVQSYREISENCRSVGLELCDPRKQVSKYLEIFEREKY